VLNGTEQTPQNNVLLRIVDWVENGNAPETLTGYKYINVSASASSLTTWCFLDSRGGLLTDLFLQDTVSLGVDFERNHCRYPRRNSCVDPENYKKPEAWKCV
jgi:feruloyl esterase